MRRSYEFVAQQWRQGTDIDLLVLASCTAMAVWLGWAMVPVALAVGVLRRRVMVGVLCIAVAVVGAVDGRYAWAHAVPRQLGPFIGRTLVVLDPVAVRGGVRVTLQIQGERFDTFLAGARFANLAQATAGDFAWVSGVRSGLGANRRRSQERHVVGRLRLEWCSDITPGSPLARAGNRVRATVRRAGNLSMLPDDAALYSGLVLGDDGREPSWLVDAFRASGLSHLTAVSGQNVSFLLAAAAPMLRRLRPWWRWSVTIALVGWFMALTRFEPSVLRAGVMAMLAATAFVIGRTASPVRLVAVAVLVLVLVDPMLVWTVGFWLSVGATLGVSGVSPWLARRLPGAPWWRAALAVTLGAQAGVALPSVLVFHRLPVVSVPANLAAVPVAGLVMLYGLPAGLAGGVIPAIAARMVMWPAAVGTRWVSTVARLSARLEPSARWEVAGWVVVGVVLALVCHNGSRRVVSDVPI
jgi:competence protein ComEC